MAHKASRVAENYIAKQTEYSTGRLFAFYLAYINKLQRELRDQKKTVMIQFNSLTFGTFNISFSFDICRWLMSSVDLKLFSLKIQHRVHIAFF